MCRPGPRPRSRAYCTGCGCWSSRWWCPGSSGSFRRRRGPGGGWLLGLTVAGAGGRGIVPAAALAGLLVHAGCELVPVREVRVLWRGHRGEVIVLGVTAVAIVVGNLFEGVLVGLAL